MSRLLRNGFLAGAAGGLVLALVLLALGETVIDRAIALESEAGGGAEEMFTRSAQTVGGVIGSIVFGSVLGLVFTTVFAAFRHRVPGSTDERRVLVTAAAGWAGATLVPFVLHPPNPPGVGDPSTVSTRTFSYIAAVACGCVAVAAATRVSRQLRRAGRSEPVAAAAGVVTGVVLVALAALLLPAAPTAGDVPADLVWAFRLRSLAGTTACWATLGLVFAALVPAALNDREPARA